jgi:hypothetical protein
LAVEDDGHAGPDSVQPELQQVDAVEDALS